MRRPALTYSRGVLELASALRHAGLEVVYANWSDERDQKAAAGLWQSADVVGVTSMTPTFRTACAILARVKASNPHALTVIGGPHISAQGKRALAECGSADVAIIGHADTVFPDLLAGPERWADLPGVVFRDGGEIVGSRADAATVNTDRLPGPAYDLLNRPLSSYAHNLRIMRGCPYRCDFCVERLSWGGIGASLYPAASVVDELRMLDGRLEAGTLVHFSDPILNPGWQPIAEVVEWLVSNDVGLEFSFDTRVDLVTPSAIRLLSSAGFVYARMGFETLSDVVLRNAHKAITAEHQATASTLIRDTDSRMAIHAYMITGLPGTSEAQLTADGEGIEELIRTKQVDVVGNKVLVPYPGTPYFDDAHSHGIRIRTLNWSKYDRRSPPVYDLANLSSDAIFDGYLRQESITTKAYRTRLVADGVRDVENLGTVSFGLDYLFRNYVQFGDAAADE